jgi:hypothetical protein
MYTEEYGTTIRSVSGQHVCTLFHPLPLASGRGSTINFNVSCCLKKQFLGGEEVDENGGNCNQCRIISFLKSLP